MHADMSGKHVLVTGSSRGIGFATVRALLDAGARVAVNGRNQVSVDRAIASLGARDGLAPAPGDIGTVAGCEAAVEAAVTAFGGLDVLINSAGVGWELPVEKCDESIWDQTLDINLKGTFFTIRAALPHLRAARGNIVNVASDAGLMGAPNMAVYCASKGGVVNMTRALALELAPDVRVNCVCPGYVDTDMVRADLIEQAADPAAEEDRIKRYHPLNTIAMPDEIAGAILYLASPLARFCTGTALQIDGGTTAGR